MDTSMSTSFRLGLSRISVSRGKGTDRTDQLECISTAACKQVTMFVFSAVVFSGLGTQLTSLPGRLGPPLRMKSRNSGTFATASPLDKLWPRFENVFQAMIDYSLKAFLKPSPTTSSNFHHP